MVLCILTYLFLLPPPTLSFASISFLLLFLEQALPPHELWDLSTASWRRKDSQKSCRPDLESLISALSAFFQQPHTLSLCGQMSWSVTPSKLLCIQPRQHMLTASCTARLDCVWPKWEAQCCSTAQELWCSPVLLASTLRSSRGRKNPSVPHPE